jgi:arginine/serine-rich splicing factor 4/5/6
LIGSASLRPVFLGNLDANFRSEDVIAIFEKPVEPPNPSMRFSPIAVDRIDVKRGYCFVFLKDVSTQTEKEQAERFVQEINGMYVTQFFSYHLRRLCLHRFLFSSPLPP